MPSKRRKATATCPECGNSGNPWCILCGGESKPIKLDWVDDDIIPICKTCGEYLDDSGDCPVCDAESLGRNIARGIEEGYKRKEMSGEEINAWRTKE